MAIIVPYFVEASEELSAKHYNTGPQNAPENLVSSLANSAVPPRTGPPAVSLLLRNSRKTECGVKQLLIRLEVRAHPLRFRGARG